MVLLHLKSLLGIYPDDRKTASIIQEMERAATEPGPPDDIAKALLSIDTSTLPDGNPADSESDDAGNISFV